MMRSRKGAVDRRTFVKDAAVAAAAASGLTGGLGALSGLLAQPRPSRPGSRLLMATGQARPFNMICLGDSVMWGQGLRDSTKFTSKIESWLESKLPGRSVNRFVFARSGATITTDSTFNESKIEDWMNNRSLGEVPCSWPYVNQQVVVARDHLASQQISADAVDLVLLDGGINDIGVTTLLDPGKTSALIQQKSAEFCGVQMSDLLVRVRNGFPNAKIVVTGYFPIVSERSDLAALGVLLAAILSVASPLVSSLPVVLAAAPLTQEARRLLTALSATWYQASNDDLGGAVASFNSKWAGSQSLQTPPAAFARIPWGPEHTYAAPETRLWLVGLPEDEVYFERRAACDAAGGAKIANFGCLEAKMGHPDPSGAAAYAAACQAQLTQYLAEWGGAKPMSACVEMDDMPTAGAATTLLVHATEVGPESWKTVRGTVRVGGQTFATDTPVPLTLCTKTTRLVGGAAASEGREREERERATGTACKPMTVSAPGYLDVVIRDYLAATPVP